VRISLEASFVACLAAAWHLVIQGWVELGRRGEEFRRQTTGRKVSAQAAQEAQETKMLMISDSGKESQRFGANELHKNASLGAPMSPR
jgi:hypothetical protein